MRKRSLLLFTVCLMLALALVFTACGGGKDNDGDTGTDKPGIENPDGTPGTDKPGIENPDGTPGTEEPVYTEALKYELNGAGDGYAVIGYEGTDTEIVISPEYESLPVTEIAQSAFESLGNITSVTIPDSVTSIGNKAFRNCSGLTLVNLGSGVTSIGDDAFA